MPPSEPVSTVGSTENLAPAPKIQAAVPRIIAGVKVEGLDFADADKMVLKLRLVGQGTEPVLPKEWADVAVSAATAVNDHGDIEIELTLVETKASAPVVELPEHEPESESKPIESV